MRLSTPSAATDGSEEVTEEVRTFRGYYYRGSGLNVGSVSDEAFCALLVSFERGQMKGCAAVFRAMVDISLKKKKNYKTFEMEESRVFVSDKGQKRSYWCLKATAPPHLLRKRF